MDEEDSGPALSRGGAVEPLNRLAIAKEHFQTPTREGERYELRDPFAEVTYHAKTFDEIVAKADQVGAFQKINRGFDIFLGCRLRLRVLELHPRRRRHHCKRIVTVDLAQQIADHLDLRPCQERIAVAGGFHQKQPVIPAGLSIFRPVGKIELGPIADHEIMLARNPHHHHVHDSPPLFARSILVVCALLVACFVADPLLAAIIAATLSISACRALIWSALY